MDETETEPGPTPEQLDAAARRIERAGGEISVFVTPAGKLEGSIKIALPGIKVWGAIDCLVNYAGYRLVGR